MATRKTQAVLERAFDSESFHCASLRKVLETAGCDVNARNPRSPHRTLLHGATSKTSAHCCPSLLVIRLVQKGSHVNARDDDGLTPLMLCKLPQVATVLLELGAEMNARSDSGTTALREAAGRGCFDVVKVLLARGADITIADSAMTTPLHIAIDKGHEDIALWLLDNMPSSADLNAKGFGTSTYLYYAAKGSLDQVTRALLKIGADPNIPCSDGCTALMFAAERGHFKVVTSLCDGGANILAVNDQGASCLQYAAQWRNADCVRYMLQRAGAALAAEGHVYSALVAACEEGQLQAAQALLDSGAVPVDQLSLIAAVHCEDEATAVKLCKALLAKGAAVDAVHCHRTALAVAALLGKAAVAAVLLRAGADVNAVSTNRDAPTSVLQYAVRGRSAAIVKALLARGADAAAVDSDGSLPLHLAAYRSTADVTRLLLRATAAAGIDVLRVREEDYISGNTPLLCAVTTGNSEVMRELLQQGASSVVEVSTMLGYTPLMVAVRHTAAVKLLLEAGAGATAVNQRTGNSALHEGKSHAVVQLLRCMTSSSLCAPVAV
jgi:ankyrin repeat protein